MRRFAAETPGLKLSQVNRGHIESFLAEIKGGDLSAKTWNNVRGYFYTMFKYAKNRGYVLENIVEKVERRRTIQTGKSR